NDSHWFMRNLLAEELHQAAELLSGDPKPRSMVEGIEAGFEAALFIGYHARAGTRHAILDHTYADRIHEVRLNGRPVGELGINAALAGVAGVPVALVSGDASLAAEATALLGANVATVVVKEAVSRHAARSVAPAVACGMLRDGVTAWLPDGSGLLYSFQRLDRPDHDRCLGLLPPDGGRLERMLCDANPAADDSTNVLTEPAPTGDGRVAYLLVGSQTIDITPDYTAV